MMNAEDKLDDQNKELRAIEAEHAKKEAEAEKQKALAQRKKQEEEDALSAKKKVDGKKKGKKSADKD